MGRIAGEVKRKATASLLRFLLLHLSVAVEFDDLHGKVIFLSA